MQSDVNFPLVLCKPTSQIIQLKFNQCKRFVLHPHFSFIYLTISILGSSIIFRLYLKYTLRFVPSKFQFGKLFLELDDLLGCQHVKAHRHARDKVSETQHVKQPNLSPHLPSKLRNLLRSNRAMPRKGNALCLAQNQFHTFYIYNVF